MFRLIGTAWLGLGGLPGSTASAVSAPLCVELVAEKLVLVGRVCVTEQGDSLLITYRTDGDWSLRETHVAVAGSRNGFPLAGGRQPILGQFGYTGTHAPGTKEVAYSVALGSLPIEVGPEVFLSVHATVVSGAEERGAWAQGAPFTPEGSPAAYFVYQRNGVPPPGGSPNGRWPRWAGISGWAGCGADVAGRAGLGFRLGRLGDGGGAPIDVRHGRAG